MYNLLGMHKPLANFPLLLISLWSIYICSKQDKLDNNSTISIESIYCRTRTLQSLIALLVLSQLQPLNYIDPFYIWQLNEYGSTFLTNPKVLVQHFLRSYCGIGNAEVPERLISTITTFQYYNPTASRLSSLSPGDAHSVLDSIHVYKGIFPPVTITCYVYYAFVASTYWLSSTMYYKNNNCFCFLFLLQLFNNAGVTTHPPLIYSFFFYFFP